MSTDPFPLLAVDGRPLGATWYRGPREARAVVVLAGATAVPARFYRAWAGDLAERGFDVLAFDYRGIGESRAGSLRSEPATMSDWGALDLQAALDRGAAEAGGRPLLFVGHSFGGQALGLVSGGERIAGGFTVGAQLGWYGHWPRSRRWGYAALWYGVVPAVAGAWGYLPGRLGVGEDLPGGVAREWARWCRSPGYLLDHVPTARDRYAAAGAPLRVFAITDDPYAPLPAVRALADVLPRALLRTWTPADAGVARLGHFGFFRPAARRLWDEATAALDLGVDAARRSA